MNAEIHGFWTIENSKSRLHGFLQAQKINADYKYLATGVDNNRYYILHNLKLFEKNQLTIILFMH